MSVKPQVKRALFIGLGGTGAKTLIALKKRFFEVYGHVDDEKGSLPEFVKFMAFDTDVPGTLKTEATARNATSGKVRQVRFEPAEVISVSAPNCGDFIQSEDNREIFNGWMPLQNSRVLSALNDLEEGAGQVRMFGRVAYFFNAQRMRSVLDKAINEVLLAGRAHEHFEPLKSGSVIDVHIVASLAGGTGSGMFMDTAMLIREILDTKGSMDDARINGYFVLPSVFIDEIGLAKMPRVLPNAFGALKELDFFMEFKKVQEARGIDSETADIWDPKKDSPLHESDDQSDELVIEYMGGESTRLTSAPYQHVYLVDSMNSQGDTYDNVKDLAECIAKGLFANVTSISTKLKSQDDNTKASLTANTFRHKKGWVGSLGVSELIYNLPEVRRHLSLRALESGLGQLLAPCESMAARALETFGSLGLIEKDEQSDLVKSLERAVPVTRKDLYEDMDPQTERTQAMSDVAKLYGTIKIEAEGIVSKVKAELENIDAHLPEVGRATARVELLKELQRQAAASKVEIEKDEGVLQKKLDEAEKELHSGTDSIEMLLDELTSAGVLKRLLRKSEIEELRNSWMEVMYEVMEMTRSSECMRQAKFVLKEFDDACNEAIERCKFANGKLDSLRQKVTDTLSHRRYSGIAKKYPTPFVMNLHVDDMEREFNPLQSDQWSQKKLLSTMDALVAKGAEDILDEACAWVDSLEMSELSDFTEIDGNSKMNMWLGEMVKEAEGHNKIAETRLGQVMADLMRRSSPLIGIDGQGVSSDAESASDRKRIEDCLQDVYMICVPSEHVAENMKRVLKPLADDRHDMEYAVVEDQSDRVTIFRRQVGAPVFALTRTKAYERAYERRHKNWRTDGEVFHTNYNWFEAMDRIGFNLNQGSSVSEQHALGMWTKAFMCGFIKWNDAQDMWEVATSNPKLQFHRGLQREELFELMMVENDFGSEVQAKLREAIKEQGFNYLSDLVNGFVVVDETRTRRATAYLTSETVNPYWKTVRPMSPYGSAYEQLNQTGSLELIQEEEKMLLEFHEKLSRGELGI